MTICGDFKKFLLRGNVLDLAVGVIIGAAFNKIVNSLVEDILMPPLGLLIGKVNFSSLYFNLDWWNRYRNLEAAKAAGAPTLNIGIFLNTIIQFLIVAGTIFSLVRFIRRLREHPEEQKDPPSRKCPFCCSDVPFEASRCKFCTSELPPAEVQPA